MIEGSEKMHANNCRASVSTKHMVKKNNRKVLFFIADTDSLQQKGVDRVLTVILNALTGTELKSLQCGARLLLSRLPFSVNSVSIFRQNL